MKVLWALLVLVPSVVSADPLKLPLTADKLYQYLTQHGITTKKDLLASLPEQVNRRVVLVRDSQSRHHSTPDRPRVIHWSPDARFIIAHGGYSRSVDPEADELEIIQVDEATQEWRFLTMTTTGGGFTPPSDVTSSCAACHGVVPRPIWGPYPNWPDAYQGSLGHKGVDRMTPDERADFETFTQVVRDDAAYSHLDINVSASGYGLKIPYGLPNTHFGARLGNRHASVVFNHLRQSPAYSAYAYTLLRLSRNSRCAPDPVVESAVQRTYASALLRSASFRERWADQPTSLARTMLYRLLGVDSLDEARLDHSPAAPLDPALGDDSLGWNTGSDGISVLVEFQVFHELLQTDARIQNWFRSKRDLIEGIKWAAFDATAEEIVAMSELQTGIDARIKQLDRRRWELVSQGGAPWEVDAELEALWKEKDERGDYYMNGLFPFLHFNIFSPVLEREYTFYVPRMGEGHKAGFCEYLSQRALAR